MVAEIRLLLEKKGERRGRMYIGFRLREEMSEKGKENKMQQRIEIENPHADYQQRCDKKGCHENEEKPLLRNLFKREGGKKGSGKKLSKVFQHRRGKDHSVHLINTFTEYFRGRNQQGEKGRAQSR